MKEEIHFLKVKKLYKKYSDNIALQNISFSINKSEKIALAGASGSGKSTLLKIITGHLQADEGEVFYNDKRLLGPLEQLLPGHKDIAYLSQHYELLNNYIVADLIWFENKLSVEDADELFEICKIKKLLQRRTDSLSGGEKQRIALCMLLVKSPKLLVLDEPFSNLDLIHKTILKDVLEDITKRLDITCLLASHDPIDTLGWADRILVLQDGKILQDATPEYLYNNPINKYVAGLFGKFNLLTLKQAKKIFDIDVFNIEQSILIRPEHITIHKNSKIEGKVIDTYFFGSYYEVSILCYEVKLLCRVNKLEVLLGDKIGIKVDENFIFKI